MPQPDITRVPAYYHGYIKQVNETDLMEAFRNQTPALLKFFRSIPPEKRDYRYAEGKWTIKEVLQHILDGERIFAYRALCFARKDTTPLPSFDENEYAAHSKADKRDWDELMEEFQAVRKSNEIMFGSFDEEQLESSGIASNNSNYVRAIGYILVGHAQHHIRITKERYLDPVSARAE